MVVPKRLFSYQELFLTRERKFLLTAKNLGQREQKAEGGRRGRRGLYNARRGWGRGAPPPHLMPKFYSLKKQFLTHA
jgi:hypothetical protein